MSPAKRMPLGLQARLIRTDLVAAGYEPELSDIRAFMDGSLSYPENRALVAKAFGYRPGTRRGAVPKNLDVLKLPGRALEPAAGRPCRCRAAPPAGKTRRPGASGASKTPARWQSDPCPGLVDVISDEGRLASFPAAGSRRRAGRFYDERRRNRSDMP